MTTSIVILTHNQLPLTYKCLQSIREHTQDYELIVVDNGSTDGTVPYLRTQSDIILHENKENLGFAKGCNQGTELSSGENVLFLNNDTIVTAHWLDNMLGVLYENERVGMVGPVTNYSSGHHQIPVTYTKLSEIDEFARKHCEENKGCYTEVRRLVGFCLLARSSVLDEIGGFDERFGLGNYEDDDLCLRALRAGYTLRVVQDSFIHHIGHATMNTLQDLNLEMLLQQNRQKASEKWGEDIHRLIYSPEVTISLCMVVRNAEESLKASILSIIDDVDEIIIIDTGSTDDTLRLAKDYTSKVFSCTQEGASTDAYELAFKQAAGEYLVWMQQGEVFDARKLRRLSSLKLSLQISPDGDLGQMLFRRADGFRLPDYLGKEAES